MTIFNRIATDAGERTCVSFPITDFQYTKQQMLTWASPFNICCFLDSHTASSAIPSPSPAKYECLLAVGVVDRLECSAGNAFDQLTAFSARHKDWIFGHLGYGLSKETELADAASGYSNVGGDPASRDLSDPVGFPDLFFFVPATVIELGTDTIRISSIEDPEAIWQSIADTRPGSPVLPGALDFTARFTREEYLGTVRKLQSHILRGDCYEINFCQEFYCRAVDLDPLSVWRLLGDASPNPFAAFYRLDSHYLICASPERYMSRKGDLLVSQPIKGTSPRRPSDPLADQASREELFHSAKNRSENVMVVDLVRNDLSKICLPGSVEVTELFGVYAFPHVFQMISTVAGRMPADMPWPRAIEATFPMGSMTGAPKKKVVSLIDRYERSSRGIFSGAVGYVTPSGDFDFNVVIRSLMYNREAAYLSYQVGSGITFYSDAEDEYEECMLKAEGIKKALGLQK